MSAPATTNGVAPATANGTAPPPTPPVVDRERLLTADEVGQRWQVPRSHVYRMAREGRVPVVKIGRYHRFSLAAIEQWETHGGAAAND